jgi:bacillithiol system protein YtxJ
MRLKPCDSLDALEPVLAGDRDALVFKHSTRCPVSRRARGEVEAFAREVPDAEVIEILVVESRPVSLGFASGRGSGTSRRRPS